MVSFLDSSLDLGGLALICLVTLALGYQFARHALRLHQIGECPAKVTPQACDEAATLLDQRVADAPPSSQPLVITVNGRKHTVSNPSPSMLLSEFLREVLSLTGTKVGCGEGGCGACTVIAVSCPSRRARPAAPSWKRSVASKGGSVIYVSSCKAADQKRPLLPAQFDEDEDDELAEAFERIAMKYITTLTKATAENNALLQRMDTADDNLGAFSPQDRANALKKSAYFEAVISHCTDFAIRCNDTSEGYQLDPDVQALRNMEAFLQGIVRDPHLSSETRRDQGV